MRYTYKKTIGAISFYKIKPDVGEDAKAQKWNWYGAEDKLGKLEDIEDELGIDLVILFKALKQDNIWVTEHNTKEQEIVYERVRLNFLNRTLDFVEPRKEIGKGRNLFDYGKTWALTKEELE